MLKLLILGATSPIARGLAMRFASEGARPYLAARDPNEVRRIIDHPGLELVQPIDDRVWDRYEVEPVDLRVNRFQTPHMLLKDGDAIFTSVMVFLRKS